MRWPSVMTMCLPCRKNSKASFFQSTNCMQMRNPWKFDHQLAATSTSRTSCPRVNSVTASKYSSIATRIFSSASCSFAPCDQQPGSPGQDTATPSSESLQHDTIRHLFMLLPPKNGPKSGIWTASDHKCIHFAQHRFCRLHIQLNIAVAIFAREDSRLSVEQRQHLSLG